MFEWLLVALSFIGVYLNVKKRAECFWLWAIADIGFVCINLSRGEYAQSVLFAMYVATAFWGYREWSKG